jgi:hypothetical protein
VSLRGRVRRLFAKFDRRVVLVEDAVESIGGAVLQMLEIKTEIQAAVARIERAVVEQGRTLGNALDGMRSEAQIRSGLGRELMEESARLDAVERRIDDLEGRHRGTAQ